MDFKKPLAWFARKIIAKHKPLIVGVTGSVGKTTTRHAIAVALAGKYKVREPEKNYNNEIGIPLTIIGTKGVDEGGGLLAWLRIFFDAAKVLYLPGSYPKVLVLEYGIDHPGDMDNLVKIAQPFIGVITTIGISHREFFNTEGEIAIEKGKLIEDLPDKGAFIYNFDDVHVKEQTKRTHAKLLSFGHTEGAQVRLEKIEEDLGLNSSTTLHIKTPTKSLEVKVPVVGQGHVDGILAAVAVAEQLELDKEVIEKSLQNYRAVPGRLNVLAGIKRTILIDDSYNAAPLSMSEALHVLDRFPGEIKVAVLGDMLELGDLTESSHEAIGKQVAKMNLQQLITVGELGGIIARAAKEAGMAHEQVISFETSELAIPELRELLQSESIILIKGSQGARMEKITKEFLAEPMSATQVLVRQYGKWLDS